jgi:hypothetical protein
MMARRKHRPAPNQSGLFGGDDAHSFGSARSRGDVGDLRSSGGSSGQLRSSPVGDRPGSALAGPVFPDGSGPGVGSAADPPSDVQSGETLVRRSVDLGGMDLGQPQAESLSSSKPPAVVDDSSKMVYLNGYGNISLVRLRELRYSGIEIDYWCLDNNRGYWIPVDEVLCYFDDRFGFPGDHNSLDWM